MKILKIFFSTCRSDREIYMTSKLDEVQEAVTKKFKKDFDCSIKSSGEKTKNDLDEILKNIATKFNSETNRYILFQLLCLINFTVNTLLCNNDKENFFGFSK